MCCVFYFLGILQIFFLSLLISNFIMMCLGMVFFVFIMFGVFLTSWIVDLSGECVISSVLSCHNKNLKWRTLKPSVHHSSWTVLQLRVIAQFYLENKGKYILEAWGHADPKDAKRRDRERERTSVHGRDPLAPWLLCLYVFFPPLGLPYVNWASQECHLFYLRSSLQSSNLPLFHFCRLFPSLSFSHHYSGLFFPILTT